jgi:hypothetical protein
MDRSRPLLPVMFLLIGASAGICWAMLYRHGEAERSEVKLGASLPPCLIGAIAGGIVGQLLLEASKKRPRIAPAIVITSAGLLGAALAAPLGWIVGDEQTVRAGEAGMMIGALMGAASGLALGVAQVARQSSAEMTDTDQ